MMGTIGSTHTTEHCALFSEPLVAELHQLEEDMRVSLGNEAVASIKSAIGAIQASRSKGVSKQHLSKIWLIKEDDAQGAIDHTTQLCRHHADNSLSRQFSTNDRMLRYRRIQSTFFTDTLVAQTTPST